jgi:hypothetical protein
MSDVRLGCILDGPRDRDAVHVAIAPVVARTLLGPGQHVGISSTGEVTDMKPYIGVIDPFLPRPVRAGERCWLFLYPQTITSLHHVWQHPAFPVEVSASQSASTVTAAPGAGARMSASQAWLRDFAGSVGLSYHELLQAAADFLATGEYLNKGEQLEGEYVPDEFWPHYEVVTNTWVAEDRRHSFFSCSC